MAERRLGQGSTTPTTELLGLVQRITRLEKEVERLHSVEGVSMNPLFETVTTIGNVEVGLSTYTGLDFRAKVVADNGTWVMARDGGHGIGLVVIYNSGDTSSAIYLVDFGEIVLVAETSNHLFTVTQGTAGHINVYHAAGVLTLENKRGFALTIRVGYFTIGPA